MRATTAGRMPRKMAATTALSLKLFEEHRYKQNDDERWQSRSKGQAERPLGLSQTIADERAHVNSHHAGTALCYSHDIDKIGTFYPFSFVHHLSLNNRNHGISPTKGKHAYLEE